MTRPLSPTAPVEPVLPEEIEAILKECETVETFVVNAIRRAIMRRRTEIQFYARGEAAWQEYRRTGVSWPFDEVCEEIQTRIDAKRRELACRGDAKP